MLQFCFLLAFSAIQNAPNPGGGDLQKVGKLSPLRVQPKKPACRGQPACRGACDSGDPGRQPGTFASQIENTPILCPFHLQPVPEYVACYVCARSHQGAFHSRSPHCFSFLRPLPLPLKLILVIVFPILKAKLNPGLVSVILYFYSL